MSSRMFRILVAVAFIGLATAFIAVAPKFNVQNVLMGLAAIISTIAALIPIARGRVSVNSRAAKPNVARHL